MIEKKEWKNKNLVNTKEMEVLLISHKVDFRARILAEIKKFISNDKEVISSRSHNPKYLHIY